MIKVLLFDLGDTLIDGAHSPFPHVPAALTAIGTFKTEAGKPLRSCLVSDFTMATPPTNANINARFAEYLAILDESGLRGFFEPVKKRVTLSTHAGVNKPKRGIFEKALHRLGVKASLEECLLITENADHIAAARGALHMQALQFRSPGAGHFDFDDWSDAPALVAARVAPQHAANLHAALKMHLAAQGIDVVAIEPAESSDVVNVSGRVWHPVSVPGHDDLRDIQVAVPVAGQVARGPKGEIHSAIRKPSDDEIAEVRSYVRSLADQGQIGGRAGQHVLRPTHEIETDDQGKRKLVRKRMSAL